MYVTPMKHLHSESSGRVKIDVARKVRDGNDTIIMILLKVPNFHFHTQLKMLNNQ